MLKYIAKRLAVGGFSPCFFLATVTFFLIAC